MALSVFLGVTLVTLFKEHFKGSAMQAFRGGQGISCTWILTKPIISDTCCHKSLLYLLLFELNETVVTDQNKK